MRKSSVFHEYAKTLTPAQAAVGIAAAINSARGLLSDAELLLENHRWPRAAALSALAIEEVGKLPILRSILLARNEEELRAEWHGYHSHTQKNVHWILLDLLRRGGRKLDDFMPIVDPRSNHGRVLDTIKQACFYSNPSPTCEWSYPEQEVGPEFAKAIFATARMLVPNAASAMASEAELEIWVKHLRPVWKGPMSEMKKALAACYAEAEARELLPSECNAESMFNFAYGDSTAFT